MYKDIKTLLDVNDCDSQKGLAMLDVLNVFSGKWKMVLICTLLRGSLRFSEIQKLIPTITPRVLSNELKELEINGILKRTAIDSISVLSQYGLTDSAKDLEPCILQLLDWGLNHRKSNTEKY